MVSVLWPVSYLTLTFGDNFAIHIMLCRFMCLFMLVLFFCIFYVGIFVEDDLLGKYLLCRVCFFGIQVRIMCVLDSSEILCDVTSLDLLVHSSSKVNGR